MDNYSTLRVIRDRLLNLFPTEGLKTQLQSRIDATLKSAFEEFGLLTQDELDQQIKALDRAQDRIDELEKILVQLESRINKAN
tara:strand:- start:787 stop:1035 length:249 start_codon:yes stop_codon:yes gene_type:complete